MILLSTSSWRDCFRRTCFLTIFLQLYIWSSYNITSTNTVNNYQYLRNCKKQRFCRKNLKIRAPRKLSGIILRSPKASQPMPPWVQLIKWPNRYMCIKKKNYLWFSNLRFWVIARFFNPSPKSPQKMPQAKNEPPWCRCSVKRRSTTLFRGLPDNFTLLFAQQNWKVRGKGGDPDIQGKVKNIISKQGGELLSILIL